MQLSYARAPARFGTNCYIVVFTILLLTLANYLAPIGMFMAAWVCCRRYDVVMTQCLLHVYVKTAPTTSL